MILACRTFVCRRTSKRERLTRGWHRSQSQDSPKGAVGEREFARGIIGKQIAFKEVSQRLTVVAGQLGLPSAGVAAVPRAKRCRSASSRKNLLTPVAAIHDVTNRTGILDSQLAGHAGRVVFTTS